MTKLVKFVEFLNKHRVLIISAWVILSLFFGFYAQNIMNKTSDKFTSEKGTDSYRANELLEKYFPNKLNEESHIIIVYDESGNVLGNELAFFTQSIINEANQRITSELLRIDGYYIYNGTEIDSIKYQFVSRDLTTSIIVFHYNAESEDHYEMVDSLRSIIEESKSILPKSYEVYSIGFLELMGDTLDGIEQDMARIDIIVIPIVFIFLIILLRNWKYFIVTMIPIIMTIVVSLGILERYIEISNTAIPSYVISVLLSLTLGIGVDYNLFLLSRFREERLKGKSVYDSVTNMMKYAGHTVLTSGLTITIALAGLLFFPLSIISAVGIGITLAIVLLLMTNLTFTPIFLLIIGSWVEPLKVENSATSNSETSRTKKSSGIWYNIGKKAIKYNYLIIIVVLLLTLPISLQLLNQDAKSQSVFYTPNNSDSRSGFEILDEKFGSGAIMPLNLIVVPKTGNVWSQDTFILIQSAIQLIIDQTDMNGFSFLSYVWMNGTKISYELAMLFMDPSSAFFNSPVARIYRIVSSNFVSNTHEYTEKAAIIQIILSEDPFSSQAGNTINIIKQVAEELFGDTYEWGLTGMAKINAEAIELTYSSFVLIILIVIFAIYALVAIMYRAVILPIRLIFTIGLTISFIFGATRLVFETNTYLNNIFPVLDDIEVTFWMVPILTFSIILGLGMDYDIFTIERIRENVKKGMSNSEAICHGIEKTGGIITGAGIIMMIAFGGLMLSSNAVLIQFGFVLTFAVFLDTFVVRTLLVPAIMSIAEKLNWWPSKISHSIT